MLKEDGFDDWAKKYDEYVKKSKGYPFEGYSDLMNEIANEITNDSNPSVLDVGIGTGVLSSLLNRHGATITGIDFSQEMIKIAKSRIKEGVFLVHNLNEGIPSELSNQSFDYIISTYVIHHFNFERKITLIEELLKHLNPGGTLLIGDVAFENKTDLEKCKRTHEEKWDEDELYFVGSELLEALKTRGINGTYKQRSSCAGLLKIVK